MRSYSAAKAYAQYQHANPSQYVRDGNKCQMFARQCVGASAWANSAIKAWHAIPEVHRHHGVPRPGSLAYYDKPYVSDRNEFGHVVFVIERGQVWSTDALRYGRVDIVPYNWFSAHWGMRYLGWIDWTPSGRINLAPTGVTPAPTLAYRQGKRVFSSKMRQGQMNSDSVWNLVLALRSHGYPSLPVGDDYIQRVRDACAGFQRKQGWTGSDANGIAGPETIRRLNLIWVNG